jgi:hypothetical protein
MVQRPAMGNINIFQQKEVEEKEAMADLKNYAQESEKQQMLYLEEQKMDLKKELEILEKQKEPPLLLEKNKAALKRDEIQKRLKVFLDEEKKVEDEEKLISEREKAVTLPSDKEKLEKKRWDIEEKRQEAEKKSWAIQRELENTEKELKTADEGCQRVVKEINETKSKIAGIDETLRSVYGGIMTREKARIAKEKEKKDIESLKQAAIASGAKQLIREQQGTNRKGVSDLSFLSKLPEGAKKERLREMMQGTADEEEEQRKKFLENVEKWSEERKNNPPNQPGPTNPQ